MKLTQWVGILAITVPTGFYFSPWLAVWLLVLAAITSRQPALGISLLFAVISIDTVRPVLGGVFVSFSELELAVCLLAWLTTTDCLNPERWRQWEWRPLKWGGPFVVAVFFSGLVNNEWYRVLPHTLRESELVLALFLGANGLRPARRGPFRWFLAGAVAFYCVAGMLQFPTARFARVFSFFTNPNQFAGYLVLVLPLVLVFCFSTPATARIFWAGLALLVAVASLVTQSRSAMAAAGGSALLMGVLACHHQARGFFRHPLTSSGAFLTRNVKTIAAILLILIVALSAVIVSSQLRDRFDLGLRHLVGRSRLGVVGSLLDLRVPYYRVGLEMWKDHFWLGVGPGNYEEVVEEYWSLVEEYRDKISYFKGFQDFIRIHLHNLYLQLAVDYGLLGLAAFLYLMARLLGHYLRWWKTSAWQLAGLGLVVGFLAQNLLDVTFPSLALETGLLLGATFQGRTLSEQPHTAERPLP